MAIAAPRNANIKTKHMQLMIDIAKGSVFLEMNCLKFYKSFKS